MSDKEDLEDGEIEDDEEETPVEVPKNDPAPVVVIDPEPSPQKTPQKPKVIENRSGSIEGRSYIFYYIFS